MYGKNHTAHGCAELAAAILKYCDEQEIDPNVTEQALAMAWVFVCSAREKPLAEFHACLFNMENIFLNHMEEE